MSRNKRLKLHSKEDRISDLPDHLIQHILTFLPSTNEAIQTTILSKRWHNQWTRVPVLVFDSSDMSTEKFSRFIDHTLIAHDCSKIKKFQVIADFEYDDMAGDLNNWDLKFRFAIRKDVEELFMDLSPFQVLFRVPKFVFEHSSYVKLHMCSCDFSTMPNQSVNWPNLKELELVSCLLRIEAIENILSGSRSLESFQFLPICPATQYGIVSKSLKKLILYDYNSSSTLQISCPNLEELLLCGRFTDSATRKLMNSSSLTHATLDFEYDYANGNYDDIKDILQFKHVKELRFGNPFIKTLSVLKSSGADLSTLLLNNKSLTLCTPKPEENNAGIECALRLSHVLEKLVIFLPTWKPPSTTNLLNLNISSENHWNSNGTPINCLVSHLKFIEIYGFSESDNQYKYVLNFIGFLLKNARVLEKMVVILKDVGNNFVVQVSQKLLEFPRCSQRATVKLFTKSPKSE